MACRESANLKTSPESGFWKGVPQQEMIERVRVRPRQYGNEFSATALIPIEGIVAVTEWGIRSQIGNQQPRQSVTQTDWKTA